MEQKPNQPSKSVQIGVWSVLGLVIAGVLFFYVRLDLMSRSDLPVIGQVPEFTLTNQFGDRVRLEDFKGKVWIADIIFTRCGGPCPRMTAKMSELQKLLPNEQIRFVTLTTDPDYDKPGVLKAFGNKYDADHDRWAFLTGSKAEIKKVAIDGLRLSAMENADAQSSDPNDIFIHSTVFMVVDKWGRVRGQTFEVLEDGLDQIVKTARELARERAR